MAASGVAFEHLDAAEIMHRWPQFRLTDDIHGLYQERGGIAMAARANAAHQRMAREHGASLRDRTPVAGIHAAGGGLAHFGLELPLEITQEQVTYFASPRRRDFLPDRFPVWIWVDDPCYYGVPVFGEDGPKAAQDAGGKPVTAETRSFEPDPENSRRVRDFLTRYLPGAVGPEIYTKTCLYTLTPDRNFVIDAVSEADGAFVAIGAGHAFKFASLIGKTLAELARDGRAEADISPFGLARPILKQKDPPRSYMV